MHEPQRLTFSWSRDEHDPERRGAAVRSALGFVAASFAEEGSEQGLELEQLLAADPAAGLNAVYALRAIAASFVIGEAQARGTDPTDVLREIEEALAGPPESPS
jgi:hypothetical protein